MKDWKDEKLLDSVRALVDEERRISLEIIHHLREIRRRRLYARRGFATMWDFMIRDLKYSEPAAQQRLAVMRVLGEAPEAEGWLAARRISFSNIVEVEKTHRATKRTIRELLSLVMDKTLREAKAALSLLHPSKRYYETVSVLPGGSLEVRLILEPQEGANLERLRELRVHDKPKFRMGKYFAAWVRSELARLDPNLQHPQKAPKVKNPYSAHVPKHLRTEIWKRDGGRCTYTDPLTGRRCEATSPLQIDHIHPRALGGRTEACNLRLYCREHNLLAAADAFGAELMETFRH